MSSCVAYRFLMRSHRIDRPADLDMARDSYDRVAHSYAHMATTGRRSSDVSPAECSCERCQRGVRNCE